MNTNKLLAGALVVLSLVFIGLTFRTVNVSVPSSDFTAGAVSGPSVDGNTFTVGGLDKYSYSQVMRVGTTTVCTIITPPVATRLESLSAFFVTSTTTAGYVTIATSTSNSIASTTVMAQAAFPASAAKFYVEATSTNSSLVNWYLGPSTWLQVTMSGGKGTFSPTGKCQAVLKGLQ